MSGEVVGGNADPGDRAMVQATGKTWNEWYEALDTAGAAHWSHPRIASWVADRHGVNGWWAEGVTVGYERARAMRSPGRLADGSFGVGASKTIPLEQGVLLDRAVDVLTSAFGAEPVTISREATCATARWSLERGEALLAQVTPTEDGRSSLVLTQSHLASADALPYVKARLRRLLDGVAAGEL